MFEDRPRGSSPPKINNPLEQCTAPCPVILRPFHMPSPRLDSFEKASACGKRTKAWRSTSKHDSPPVKTPTAVEWNTYIPQNGMKKVQQGSRVRGEGLGIL